MKTLLKYATIAACWLHTIFHDKPSGYAGFFTIIVLWLANMLEGHTLKRTTNATFLLNIIVAVSILAFAITLHFYH